MQLSLFHLSKPTLKKKLVNNVMGLDHEEQIKTNIYVRRV